MSVHKLEVGDTVHFYESSTTIDMKRSICGPFAATVLHVNHDRSLNLWVVSKIGTPFAKREVKFASVIVPWNIDGCWCQARPTPAAARPCPPNHSIDAARHFVEALRHGQAVPTLREYRHDGVLYPSLEEARAAAHDQRTRTTRVENVGTANEGCGLSAGVIDDPKPSACGESGDQS